MEIKREGVAKNKMIRRVVYLTLTVAALAAAGWRLDQLKPARSRSSAAQSSSIR
jgi:hypothetical protein